jgi:hypothetical protein
MQLKPGSGSSGSWSSHLMSEGSFHTRRGSSLPLVDAGNWETWLGRCRKARMDTVLVIALSILCFVGVYVSSVVSSATKQSLPSTSGSALSPISRLGATRSTLNKSEVRPPAAAMTIVLSILERSSFCSLLLHEDVPL